VDLQQKRINDIYRITRNQSFPFGTFEYYNKKKGCVNPQLDRFGRRKVTGRSRPSVPSVDKLRLDFIDPADKKKGSDKGSKRCTLCIRKCLIKGSNPGFIGWVLHLISDSAGLFVAITSEPGLACLRLEIGVWCPKGHSPCVTSGSA
jgi:hypothetical protein